MAYWQTSIPRAAPKTKAELREMLAEAVRNTQPGKNSEPKGKRLPKTETTATARVD